MTSTDDGPPGKRTERKPGVTIDLTAEEIARADGESVAGPREDAEAAAAEAEAAAAKAAAAEAAGQSTARPAPDAQRGALAAIVIAAVIGAAAGVGGAFLGAEMLQPPASADDRAALQALQTRLDAVESRGTAEPPGAAETGVLRAAIGDLGGRVDALAAKVDAAPTPDSTRIDTVEKQLTDLSATVSQAPPPVDLSPVDTRLGELGGRLDTLEKTVAGLADQAGREANQAGALGERIDALEQQQATTAEALDGLGRAVEGLVRTVDGAGGPDPAALGFAAASLARSVDDGRPFAAELAILRGRVGDEAALGALAQSAETGVPTRTRLMALFEEAEPKIAATATPAPEGGVLDQLQASAQGLIGLRRVGPVEGDDPAAVASRIAAAMAGDDLAEAAALWKGLPDTAKAAAPEFGTALETRLAAEAAAASVTRDVAALLQRAQSPTPAAPTSEAPAADGPAVEPPSDAPAAPGASAPADAAAPADAPTE